MALYQSLLTKTFQVAVAAGATVIATSSSDEKLEVARKLGAKHLINYRKTPDWSAEALKITDNVGVDIVVDVVGGSELGQSIASLRRGGRVAVLGLLDKDDKPLALNLPILYGAKTGKIRSISDERFCSETDTTKCKVFSDLVAGSWRLSSVLSSTSTKSIHQLQHLSHSRRRTRRSML